jgi:K+-transporting ATPase c subunit
VAQLGASIAEHLADQQSPVAVARVAAAAQESEPVVLRSLQQPVDRRHEVGFLGHRSVQRVSLTVVVFFSLGTAA